LKVIIVDLKVTGVNFKVTRINFKVTSVRFQVASVSLFTGLKYVMFNKTGHKLPRLFVSLKTALLERQ